MLTCINLSFELVGIPKDIVFNSTLLRVRIFVTSRVGRNYHMTRVQLQLSYPKFQTGFLERISIILKFRTSIRINDRSSMIGRGFLDLGFTRGLFTKFKVVFFHARRSLIKGQGVPTDEDFIQRASGFLYMKVYLT